jgi:hypothetical protein
MKVKNMGSIPNDFIGTIEHCDGMRGKSVGPFIVAL